MADYLLAEVLERQSEEVRLLLLRTSVLDRVNGELADLLTGRTGGAGVLQELEAVNAFVVSVDARRTWFRYHRLFADLLRLELRQTAPDELSGLHATAAGWFAGHGYQVEAVRHAQAAKDWRLAARLLSDAWLSLALDGQQETAHQLLTGFPPGVAAGDPELIALTADDELNRGSLEKADRHLASATAELASVPAERRGHLQVTLGILRLSLARQRGDVPAVAEEAQRLLAPVEAADWTDLGMSEERRALALISLGIAETWAYRSDEAERHLEQGVALARQIGRPYLELTGLAHSAAAMSFRSYTAGAQLGRQAIELAERHGWGEEPIAGVAYAQLAGVLVGQGQLEEAERWFGRAGRALRAELEPAAGINMHWPRAVLELVRGRTQRALDAIRAAEALSGQLRTPYADNAWMRADFLQILVRVGQTERVEAALAQMSEEQLDTADMRSVIAALCDGRRRSAGSHHSARARHRRLCPGMASDVAGARIPAGGDRTGCFRRLRRCRRAPSSEHWISPSPTACACHSCSIRPRHCSSAMPGSTPRTSISSRRFLGLLAGAASPGADAICPAVRRTAKAARAAQPGRDPRPALPAHQPHRARKSPSSYTCR